MWFHQSFTFMVRFAYRYGNLSRPFLKGLLSFLTWNISLKIWYSKILLHLNLEVLGIFLKTWNDWFDLIVFNSTFSNISAISWWPVLVVEETGIPGENYRPSWHGQATGKLYHLRLRVEFTLFCNLQSWARTHAILVIGLYELLGNPTT